MVLLGKTSNQSGGGGGGGGGGGAINNFLDTHSHHLSDTILSG